MTAPPLHGIRVLDFAWIGAGALVTKALAELGAEIIRIESTARPDNLRVSPPFRPGTSGLDASGYFASRNPGKRSVALDMKHPAARDVALRLAVLSDVFVSNFRTGVLERWGLSHDELRAVNPRLVMLAMPMQGSDGPHRDFVGFGSTIAALAGLVHATGVPGRAPVGTGTHYPDHVPNPGHALVALLSAIYHQQRTGEGQVVELSQLESTVNVVGQGVLAASLGDVPGPAGNHAPTAAPRGVYACSDGEWLAVVCGTDDQFAALVTELGAGRLATDPRFRDALQRGRHVDELDGVLRPLVAGRDRAGLAAALCAAGVPSGAVNNARDMLEDERLRRRGFWQHVDHAVIGDVPMFHLPFRMTGVERGRLDPPPLLGEHTREVATGLLGLSDEEFEAMVSDGVFR